MCQKLVLLLVGGRKAIKMKCLLDPDGLVCPGKVAPGQRPDPARAGTWLEAAGPDVVWGGGFIKLFSVGSLEVIRLLGLCLLLHVCPYESQGSREQGQEKHRT